MKRRLAGFFIVALCASVLLAGCGNNPDTLFKKGKFAEAYPEFIKRAGTNEVALKQETTNGSFSTRNTAGNQAIHDLYYAAECQKKLGNTGEAAALYRRVVDLSQYQIRIPSDKAALLKDAMEKLAQAAREVRSQEVSYGRAYHDWENTPDTDTNTDPYDNGGSNTDPYDNGGSNTDPYDNGGSTTDPYDNNSGSNTDPYARTGSARTTSAAATRGEAPSRYWLDNAVSTLRTRQREYERLMFSATKEEIPSIDSIKAEYDRFTRALDSYLMYAAPGGILFNPDSIPSELMWRSFEGNLNTLTRGVYGAQGTVTYTSQALQLKEPALVSQAQAALRELGAASTSATAPAANKATTGSVTPAKVDSTGSTPYGQ